IKWHVGISKSRNASSVSQSFIQSLTEHPADIFYSVVPVDVKIAFGFDVQIHPPMACELREHVIEERNAGLYLELAGSIQVQLNLDIGFIRLAGFGYNAGFFHFFTSFGSALSRAARNLLFCSGVPTVTRSTRSSMGYVLTSRTRTPCA